MNVNACEPQNAEAFLRGEFSSEQENAYIQHLDSCVDCRKHLESTAAAGRSASEFEELLRPQNATRYFVAQPNKSDTEYDSAEAGEQHIPLAVQQVIKSLHPTDDPESMGRVDNFEIKGVVGSGAMGVVLKAKDTLLDRIVALKVMTPCLAASGTARARFEREAKAAAAVHHPNVVAIHGVQTSAELPYLVMPYLKGISLHRRVESQGPLSLQEILRVGSQIAAGLAAAHRQGVIHRDIKPSNIMLDEGVEAAVITDFGLARIVDDATMTRTGVISGTPEFMSPEQARGDAMDAQSDLFSLGSLLYMLCTGYPPFRAETSFGVLRRITDDAPKPIRQINADIPEWLCSIVEELQQKTPKDRPSAQETAADLEAFLAHVYQPDKVPLPEKYCAAPRKTKPTSYRYVPLGVLAMFALLTAAIFAILNDGTGTQSSRETEVMPTKITAAEVASPRLYKSLALSFPNAKKRGKLIVDINRGFIEVTTHEKPTVVVDVLCPPNHGKPSDSKTLTQQFSPRFDLDYKQETNAIKIDTYNQNYPLNLRITVPKKTDLDLDTYRDGYLVVTGVSGKLRTHSQHCDITLKNVAGTATAYSYNGNIDVSFRKLNATARLDFESYNGSINLALPKDAGITAAISSGNGTFGSEFDIAAPSDKDLQNPLLKELSTTEYSIGTINHGGTPLRIECAKGTISLRKS